MKKYIIYIIITISIISLSVLLYISFFTKKANKTVDITKIKSVTFDGNEYKTTGNIPSIDINSRESFQQIIKLASIGKINNPKFEITTSNDGIVRIRIIDTNYEEAKIEAISWMKTNGYEKISTESIQFIP